MFHIIQPLVLKKKQDLNKIQSKTSNDDDIQGIKLVVEVFDF